MRISALAGEHFRSSSEPAVSRAFDEAIVARCAIAAIVEEARGPLRFRGHDGTQRPHHRRRSLGHAPAYIGDPALDIDPWVRKRTHGGKSISAADYIAELAQRQRSAKAFADWMQGRDALLTPTLPISATVLDQVDEAATPLATFTRVANYLGACALSLPAGFSDDGLPVAVQLVGSPFTEPTLVRIGRAFQDATDWHLKRPDLGALGTPR